MKPVAVLTRQDHPFNRVLRLFIRILRRCIWAVIIIAITGCVMRQPAHPAYAGNLDSHLFDRVLHAIASDPGNRSIRVDPRPMIASPDLVTLHSVDGIIPERLRGIDHNASVAADDQLLNARRSVLARLRYQETDAFR